MPSRTLIHVQAGIKNCRNCIIDVFDSSFATPEGVKMVNIVQVTFPGCQLVNYLAIELALCQVNDGWERKLKLFCNCFFKNIFLY